MKALKGEINQLITDKKPKIPYNLCIMLLYLGIPKNNRKCQRSYDTLSVSSLSRASRQVLVHTINLPNRRFP